MVYAIDSYIDPEIAQAIHILRPRSLLTFSCVIIVLVMHQSPERVLANRYQNGIRLVATGFPYSKGEQEGAIAIVSKSRVLTGLHTFVNFIA